VIARVVVGHRLMRRRFILVAVIAGMLAMAAPASAGQMVERPFRANLHGWASFEATETCPLGVRTHSDASGTARHLGRSTLDGVHCPTMGSPSIPFGQLVIVGANGDKLYGTYVSHCTPLMPDTPGEVVTCTGEVQITGGTGRFQGASGSMDQLVKITFPGWEAPMWPMTYHLAGWLRY
jgi:hypothetical protein